MESSKIKNIIIIILLFLNVVLLSISVFDARRSSVIDKAELRAAENILEKNGISVADGVKLNKIAPKGCSVVRNGEQEQSNVRRLIGKGATEDLGGNIRYYSGANGQASCRGTGEMDMLLESGTVKTGNDVVKTALRTLEKLGLSGDGKFADVTGEDDSYTVSICCAWEDSTVYNAKMQFSFAGGRLIMISGTRAFDVKTETSTAEPMNYTSAILRFIEIINENGYICSKITGFDAGYIMNVAVSGESVLTPVWRIETDTGIYYVNAENGRQETVTA